jgi:hypothetical protein
LACSPAALAASADEAASLGQWEGIVSFCGRAHPDLAARLQDRLKAMFAAAPETDLAKARALPAYKQRFDATVAEFGRQSEQANTKACTDFADAH